MMNLRQALIGAASLIALTVPAIAAETVKIAFIDPLSGGGAPTGENGLKTLSVLRRVPQRRRRAAAKSSRSAATTTRSIRRRSLVQVQKAIDDGIRYIMQGNGSLGRRRDRRLRAEVQRAQSRQGGGVPQLRRRRSGADQREMQLLALPLRRRLRHEDGGDDQLHEGAHTNIKKVYLINQDYSFGQAVRDGGHARCSARSVPTSRSSATSCIRCRRSTISRPTSPRSRPRAPTPSSPATGARTWRC